MPKPSAHKHVSWRDGRPRFQPDQLLRGKGFKGTDLRWPKEPAAGWKPADLQPGDKNDGRWFTKGEAVDWSEAFVASLKQPKAKRVGKPAQRARFYTVAQMFEDWRRSPKFQLPTDPAELRRKREARAVYSQHTVDDYKQKAGVIEKHDPTLWASPVDALSQPVLFGLYEELVEARGLATARGAILTFSAALGWARRRGKTTFRSNNGVNPALDLNMATPAPRVRFGSRQEIETLVAVADHLGWPEMGDMIVLGVWTGQRQADRLLMADKGQLNGRRIFRQAKTGAIVSVREAPELRARLEASKERRKANDIVNPRVILDEQVWKPFPEDGWRYRKRFAELREIAANGIVDEDKTAALVAQWQAEGRNSEPPVVWKIAPCKSLLGNKEEGLLPFFEMDLRDTFVTWNALAGATIPEIVAITGHSLESATRILKHYLARHPEMADSAIRKMVEWYEADGETEIGL